MNPADDKEDDHPVDPGDFTRELRAAAGGDAQAGERLLPVVYGELRALARARMRRERKDHTLQATELVHEAYLRLVSGTPAEWEGRGHFFAAAAEAMRRILIEHARARGRAKRGGDEQGRAPKKLSLSLAGIADLAADTDPEDIPRPRRGDAAVGSAGRPHGSGGAPALLRGSQHRGNGRSARGGAAHGEARLDVRAGLALRATLHPMISRGSFTLRGGPGLSHLSIGSVGQRVSDHRRSALAGPAGLTWQGDANLYYACRWRTKGGPR